MTQNGIKRGRFENVEKERVYIITNCLTLVQFYLFKTEIIPLIPLLLLEVKQFVVAGVPRRRKVFVRVGRIQLRTTAVAKVLPAFPARHL